MSGTNLLYQGRPVLLAARQFGQRAAGRPQMHPQQRISAGGTGRNTLRARLIQGERARLLTAIRDRPGIAFSELRPTPGHNGHTQHHLRMLEIAGLIRSLKHGHCRRYYEASLGRAGAQLCTAADPRLGPILESARDQPRISIEEIRSRLTQRTHQAILYHVRRLERTGLVTVRRRVSVIELTQAGQHALTLTEPGKRTPVGLPPHGARLPDCHGGDGMSNDEVIVIEVEHGCVTQVYWWDARLRQRIAEVGANLYIVRHRDAIKVGGQDPLHPEASA